MNIDALTTILKMMGNQNMQNNTGACHEQRNNNGFEQPNASKSRFRANVDKQYVKSAFCTQNGIGEQVQPYRDKQEKGEDIFDAIAGQNPIFNVLKALKNGDADTSSLLPVIMSLMQNTSTFSQQDKRTAENNPDDSIANKNQPKSDCKNSDTKKVDNLEKEDKNTSITPQNASADVVNTENNDENTYKTNKEKTQRDMFAPVAFAGYEILCTLCALIKELRHFDK